MIAACSGHKTLQVQNSAYGLLKPAPRPLYGVFTAKVSTLFLFLRVQVHSHAFRFIAVKFAVISTVVEPGPEALLFRVYELPINRKSAEIVDTARKMHFHALLCLAEASCLGHLFSY
jgi:hypothetical protein